MAVSTVSEMALTAIYEEAEEGGYVGYIAGAAGREHSRRNAGRGCART
ncbi:MAG TPA: hypothetical protein VEZ90_13590 [Blastocatellia bacterium]|nr:hypothetical protein [Blastocatellia bacterium]